MESLTLLQHSSTSGDGDHQETGQDEFRHQQSERRGSQQSGSDEGAVVGLRRHSSSSLSSGRNRQRRSSSSGNVLVVGAAPVPGVEAPGGEATTDRMPLLRRKKADLPDREDPPAGGEATTGPLREEADLPDREDPPLPDKGAAQIQNYMPIEEVEEDEHPEEESSQLYSSSSQDFHVLVGAGPRREESRRVRYGADRGRLNEKYKWSENQPAELPGAPHDHEDEEDMENFEQGSDLALLLPVLGFAILLLMVVIVLLCCIVCGCVASPTKTSTTSKHATSSSSDSTATSSLVTRDRADHEHHPTEIFYLIHFSHMSYTHARSPCSYAYTDKDTLYHTHQICRTTGET